VASAFSTERTQAVAMLTIDAQLATLAVEVGSAALGASVGTLRQPGHARGRSDTSKNPVFRTDRGLTVAKSWWKMAI
jgi:hypothetical protein